MEPFLNWFLRVRGSYTHCFDAIYAYLSRFTHFCLNVGNVAIYAFWEPKQCETWAASQKNIISSPGQGMLVICWSVLRLSPPPASSIAISSAPLLDVAFLGPASVIVVDARPASPCHTASALLPYSHRTPGLPNWLISAQYLLQSSCHCTVVHRLSRCGRSVEKCKWHCRRASRL